MIYSEAFHLFIFKKLNLTMTIKQMSLCKHFVLISYSNLYLCIHVKPCDFEIGFVLFFFFMWILDEQVGSLWRSWDKETQRRLDVKTGLKPRCYQQLGNGIMYFNTMKVDMYNMTSLHHYIIVRCTLCCPVWVNCWEL